MKWLFAAAFFFVALMLGPALAHLFELPNKMQLAEADHVTVQGIYPGWSLFGWVIGTALVAVVALAASLRAQRTAMLWAVAAAAAIVGGQVLFWIFVFPANQATADWTTVPENWLVLRRRWEYGHAFSAVLDLGA